MISGTSHLNLFVLVVYLSMKGLHSRPYDTSDIPSCPTTGVPRDGRRGTNVIHGRKPQFRLDMEEAKYGFVPGMYYELFIIAQDPSRKFTDALISISTNSENCGEGSFVIDRTSHGQTPNCSHMMYKISKTPEHSFGFTWMAPNCGCIDFRARVTSSENVYFLEDEGVRNGHLSKRICPKDHTKLVSKLPRSKRIKLLCAINKETSSTELANRPDVLSRRKLDIRQMSLLRMEDLKINLQRRSNEVKDCCTKSSYYGLKSHAYNKFIYLDKKIEEMCLKIQKNYIRTGNSNMWPDEHLQSKPEMSGRSQDECFGDIRRLRIDQFCEDGEPIIPFTVTRHVFMMKHKEECCWKLGERRYACFAGASGPLHRKGAAGHQADWVTRTNEMDESDPLNDLEDYPTELSRKLIEMNILPKSETLYKDRRKEKGDKHVAKKLQPPVVKKQPLVVNTDVHTIATTQTDREDDRETTTDVSTTTRSAKRISTTTTARTKTTTTTTTQTTAELFQAFKKAQMSYECCNSGKQFGMDVVQGDYWRVCERSARKHSRSRYRRGRGKCRRYYHQCCVEQVQLQEAVQDEDANDENDDTDVGRETPSPSTNERQSREQLITGENNDNINSDNGRDKIDDDESNNEDSNNEDSNNEDSNDEDSNDEDSNNEEIHNENSNNDNSEGENPDRTRNDKDDGDISEESDTDESEHNDQDNSYDESDINDNKSDDRTVDNSTSHADNRHDDNNRQNTKIHRLNNDNDQQQTHTYHDNSEIKSKLRTTTASIVDKARDLNSGEQRPVRKRSKKNKRRRRKNRKNKKRKSRN